MTKPTEMLCKRNLYFSDSANFSLIVLARHQEWCRSNHTFVTSLHILKAAQSADAPEKNNLEPFSSDELLSELENWADILKAEPEAIHRLEEISAHKHEAFVEDDAVPRSSMPGEPSP